MAVDSKIIQRLRESVEEINVGSVDEFMRVRQQERDPDEPALEAVVCPDGRVRHRRLLGLQRRRCGLTRVTGAIRSEAALLCTMERLMAVAESVGKRTAMLIDSIHDQCFDLGKEAESKCIEEKALGELLLMQHRRAVRELRKSIQDPTIPRPYVIPCATELQQEALTLFGLADGGGIARFGNHDLRKEFPRPGETDEQTITRFSLQGVVEIMPDVPENVQFCLAKMLYRNLISCSPQDKFPEHSETIAATGRGLAGFDHPSVFAIAADAHFNMRDETRRSVETGVLVLDKHVPEGERIAWLFVDTFDGHYRRSTFAQGVEKARHHYRELGDILQPLVETERIIPMLAVVNTRNSTLEFVNEEL